MSGKPNQSKKPHANSAAARRGAEKAGAKSGGAGSFANKPTIINVDRKYTRTTIKENTEDWFNRHKQFGLRLFGSNTEWSGWCMQGGDLFEQAYTTQGIMFDLARAGRDDASKKAEKKLQIIFEQFNKIVDEMNKMVKQKCPHSKDPIQKLKNAVEKRE